MNCEQARIDVAAHALGTLNKADGEAVDGHMRECRACRAAYEEHASLVLLMAAVSPRDIIPLSPSGSSDDGGDTARQGAPGPTDVLREAAGARRRPVLPGDGYADPRARRHRRAGRSRLALLATAVAALPSAAVLWFIVQAQPSDVDSAPPAEAVARTVRASDAPVGVRAAVTARDEKWGTDLRLDLAVAGGMSGKCRLVVVTDSGEHETVGSWSMQPGGDGARGTPLKVTGTTALPRERIEAYVIERMTGAGDWRRLRVPAS